MNGPPVTRPAKIPKTLIVCFDGTANGVERMSSSNIGTFFEGLNKDNDYQLCYYQPGIGTYIPSTRVFSMLPELSHAALKASDEAVAWSLGDHILAGYQFLMDHYSSGDKICIFGFSRGAYIARALASMLHRVGLLCKGNTEYVSTAFLNFSRDADIGDRGRAAKRACDNVKRKSRVVSVEFLGVWDTVTSVGISGRTLPLGLVGGAVKHYRHALALDERRAKFLYRPLQFDVNQGADVQPEVLQNASETAKTGIRGLKKMGGNLFRAPSVSETPKSPESPTPMSPMSANSDDYIGYESTRQTPLTVEEVWFVGAHSDVGGSGKTIESKALDPKLSNLSLLWMLQELDSVGVQLDFKEDAFIDSALIQSYVKREPEFKALMKWVEEKVPIPSPWPPAQVERPKEGFRMVESLRAPPKFEGQAISGLLPDVFAEIHDSLSGASPWWLVEALSVKSTDILAGMASTGTSLLNYAGKATVGASMTDRLGSAATNTFNNVGISNEQLASMGLTGKREEIVAGTPREVFKGSKFHWSVKLRLSADPNYRPNALVKSDPTFIYGLSEPPTSP